MFKRDLCKCDTCADPEGGGQGVRTPAKNHKNIGFLSNTGQHPLKNRGIAYSCIWILSPLINQRKIVRVGPPLTKLSGPALGILPKAHVEPNIYRNIGHADVGRLNKTSAEEKFTCVFYAR